MRSITLHDSRSLLLLHSCRAQCPTPLHAVLVLLPSVCVHLEILLFKLMRGCLTLLPVECE